MAPTEVLAEQHYLGVKDMLGDLMVPDPTSLMGDRPLACGVVDQQCWRLPAPQGSRRPRLSAKVDIVIGTHALIQEKVQYRSLGVVVIDEQHRFGVEQRAALREKGDSIRMFLTCW